MDVWDEALLFQPKKKVSVVDVHLDAALRPGIRIQRHTDEKLLEREDDINAALVGVLEHLPLRHAVPEKGPVLARKLTTVPQVRQFFADLGAHPVDAARFNAAGAWFQSLADRPRTAAGRSKILGRGRAGVVAHGMFPQPAPLIDAVLQGNAMPPFLVKVGVSRDDEIEQLNELAVGLFALNPLRAECPNFMYVYGSYRCPPPKITKTGVTPCAGRGEPVPYLMVEAIPGMTLEQWTKKGSPGGVAALQEIITQVVLALGLANERIGFSHNDLYLGNVMVEPLNRPLRMSYSVGGRTFSFTALHYLARIIDFGRASATVPRSSIGKAQVPAQDLAVLKQEGVATAHDLHLGSASSHLGLSPIHPNLLGDLVRFLGDTVGHYLGGLKGSALYRRARDLFLPFWGTMTATEADRAWTDHGWFGEWTRHEGGLAPFGLEVDPLELIDLWERAGWVPADWRSTGKMSVMRHPVDVFPPGVKRPRFGLVLRRKKLFAAVSPALTVASAAERLRGPKARGVKTRDLLALLETQPRPSADLELVRATLARRLGKAFRG